MLSKPHSTTTNPIQLKLFHTRVSPRLCARFHPLASPPIESLFFANQYDTNFRSPTLPNPLPFASASRVSSLGVRNLHLSVPARICPDCVQVPALPDNNENA